MELTMGCYNTILLEKNKDHMIITLHRPEARNSLNADLINEIHAVLDQAEMDDQCKVIMVRGENQIFCTGMDFQQVVNTQNNPVNIEQQVQYNSRYMHLLHRLSTISKITVSIVEGQVLAGGVGIAAASNLVLASPTATFSLSEALWGLLPSMVLPYLIRRVGYQTAYRMTLTTEQFNIQQAEKSKLVDIVAENVNIEMCRLLQRLTRLQIQTITDLKSYFNQLSPITLEQTNAAIHETARLSTQPRVIKNIVDYVQDQKFPWN